MTAREEKINELFEELVPDSGKAATVAGEIIRAISRIGYRNSNDGDHVGVGYGKETCNPAARYLMKKAGEEVADAIADLWGLEPDDLYDERLAEVEEAVIAYIEKHPELKEIENTEDMWDYRNEYDDADDEWDEDDEYYEDEYDDEEDY